MFCYKELIISGDIYFEAMKYTGDFIAVIGNGLLFITHVALLMDFSAAANGSLSRLPLTSLQERPWTQVRVNGPATRL
jgi:hypothetical protein